MTSKIYDPASIQELHRKGKLLLEIKVKYLIKTAHVYICVFF